MVPPDATYSAGVQVGSPHYEVHGGIHRILVPGATAGLHAAAFAVTGPDPAAALEDVGAGLMVCLVTDPEITMRYPHYADWLARPEPHAAIHLPVEDHGVASDAAIAGLVDRINTHMDAGTGVLVHCGAGYGRAGVVCISVLTARGVPPEQAIAAVRAARPAAGPQSQAQYDQVARLARRS